MGTAEPIAIELIRSGMMLGKTLMAGGRVLLAAGTMLKEAYIPLLMSHGVTTVVATHTVSLRPTLAVSQSTHHSLIGQMGKVFSRVNTLFVASALDATAPARVDLDVVAITEDVDTVVAEVLANTTAAFQPHDGGPSAEDMLGHSVNVCILTTMLGVEVGYKPSELRPLALGALLHDVGKQGVPPGILKKPGRLTPEEFRVMQSHTTLGWNILRGQGGMPHSAAVMALQHHERWNGGGYPHNLKGEQIHPNARLCAVADCFEALTSDRVYRKALAPTRALEIMETDMATTFAPGLLDRFARCVAPYPVGSVVELNDGRQAVVLAVSRGKTKRPNVQLLDPDGAILVGHQLDLDADRSVSVVRLVHWGGVVLPVEVMA